MTYSPTRFAVILFALHAFGLVGCSTPIVRAPAAIEAKEEEAPADINPDEVEFQKIFQLNEPKPIHEKLQVKFDQTEEAFFRGHSALKNFDKVLDQNVQAGGSLETFYSEVIKSGVYARLLSIRDHRTSQQHQLVYFCRRFIEISRNPQSRPEEVKLASDALDFIGTYFRKSPPHYRAALFSLGVELLPQIAQSTSLRLGVNRILYGDIAGPPTEKAFLPDYVKQAKVMAKIDQITERLEAKSTVLSEKIEESVKTVDSLMMTPNEGRSPQALRIEPGLGSSGNITGNAFPAGVWSLTFDDGPHGRYTRQVLKNLQDNHMRATFFMLARQAAEFPNVAQEVKAAGMEIANHSYNHPRLTELSDSQLDHEVHGAEEKLAEIVGDRPKLFRCPYGRGVNLPRVRAAIFKEKMVHVFWNVDSLDWQDHNPTSIVTRVKKQMAMSKGGGGVILFHDIHPQSVEASKRIMQDYKQDEKIHEMRVGDVIDLINNGANP